MIWRWSSTMICFLVKYKSSHRDRDHFPVYGPGRESVHVVSDVNGAAFAQNPLRSKCTDGCQEGKVGGEETIKRWEYWVCMTSTRYRSSIFWYRRLWVLILTSRCQVVEERNG